MKARKDMVTQTELEQSPDYWWLRFRYAVREGRTRDADEARQRLRDLGVKVDLCDPEPTAQREGGA